MEGTGARPLRQGGGAAARDAQVRSPCSPNTVWRPFDATVTRGAGRRRAAVRPGRRAGATRAGCAGVARAQRPGRGRGRGTARRGGLERDWRVQEEVPGTAAPGAVRPLEAAQSVTVVDTDEARREGAASLGG